MPIFILRYTFLAFGHGPRACIGMRFATLEVKMALATMLGKYNFAFCNKTVQEIKLDPKSGLKSNFGGIWLKIENRH